MRLLSVSAAGGPSLPLVVLDTTLSLAWVGRDCRSGWLPRAPLAASCIGRPSQPNLSKGPGWVQQTAKNIQTALNLSCHIHLLLLFPTPLCSSALHQLLNPRPQLFLGMSHRICLSRLPVTSILFFLPTRPLLRLPLPFRPCTSALLHFNTPPPLLTPSSIPLRNSFGCIFSFSSSTHFSCCALNHPP